MHPHIAQASAQVEAVKQAMALGPGGVPNVLAGAVAPWAPFMPGTPPPGGPPGGGPFILPGTASAPGMAPPMTGGPMGGGVPVPPAYGMGAGNPYAMHAQAMHGAAEGMRRTIMMVVIGVVVASFVMVIAAVVLMVVLAR